MARYLNPCTIARGVAPHEEFTGGLSRFRVTASDAVAGASSTGDSVLGAMVVQSVQSPREGTQIPGTVHGAPNLIAATN